MYFIDNNIKYVEINYKYPRKLTKPDFEEE